MAEGSSQERTEQPTAKRLREARDKGQIPRSRELTTTMILLLGSAGLFLLGSGMIEKLQLIMAEGFSLTREQVFDAATPAIMLSHSIEQALWLLAPFLFIVVGISMLSPLALSGWTFSAQALVFKWEKLNPIKGLGRVFAWRGLLELVKALAKFVLVLTVLLLLLWGLGDRLIGLGYQDVAAAMASAGHLLGWSFIALSSIMLLVSAVDVPFQIWDHRNKLKMTRQELKDEHKETEGSPEVRGRLRRLQQEIAQRRMMTEVPKADVIITNPTHFAVALRYDPRKMRAPLLVAKGTDLVATQIRKVGQAHGVPFVAAPPLSRALYYSTDLQQEIPAGLYVAVAQVLAYVHQLKDSGRRHAHYEPYRMSDLPIPDEFKR